MKIAIRQHEKAESPYLKLVLEKAGAKKTTVFGFKKKKKPGDEGGGGPQLDRKSPWFRGKTREGTTTTISSSGESVAFLLQ